MPEVTGEGISVHPFYLESKLQKEFLTFLRKPKSLYRLSGIPDYAGKTRVVAIGPDILQTVLRPMHDYLMDMLKRIQEDCS